jgi:hypothetical protein
VEALNPVASWKGGLKQQGAYDIICVANHALNLAILRGGVGARHPELDAMGEEEGAGGGVIELASIIVMDTPDGATKLRGYVGKEVRGGGESIRLVA